MTVTDRAPTDESAEEGTVAPATRRVVNRVGAWVLQHPIAAVALVAGAIRTAVAVAVTLFVEGVVIPDEAQYIELAKIAANDELEPTVWRGYGLSLWWALGAFVRPLSWLFRIIGPWAILGRLAAALLGAAAAAAAVALTRRVASTRWALLAGGLVAVLPSQVLWSSVVLRESMIWSLAAAPGVALTIASKSKRLPVLLACAAAAGVAIFLLIYSRPQTMVIVAWSLALASLTFRSQRRVLVPLGAIAIAVLVPWWQHLGPAAWTFVDSRAGGLSKTRTHLSLNAETAISPLSTLPATTTTTPATTTTTRQTGGRGGGSGGPRTTSTLPPAEEEPTTTTTGPHFEVPEDVLYVGETVVVFDSSWSGTLKHLPRGIVAVALRPLPWDATSGPSLFMAKVENALWIGFYVLAAVGAWVNRRRRDVLAYPFVVLVGIVGVAAVTQGNIGTAFRHRGQVLWALAIFVALGAREITNRVRAARSLPDPAERVGSST